MKRSLWIWAVLIVCLLAALAAAVPGFFLPWLEAGCELAEGEFLLTQQRNGALLLSWPQAEGADFYRVELLTPSEGWPDRGELLYRGTAASASDFALPELGEEAVTIRVRAGVNYENALRPAIRYSRPMEATVSLAAPEISGLRWSADAGTGTVTLEVDLPEGLRWHYQLRDENDAPAAEAVTEEGTLRLQFGDEGYPLPAYGGMYQLLVSAWRQEPGLLYRGRVTREVIITREDLLGTELAPQLREGRGNTAAITWQETKGTGYEVQLLDRDCWITLRRVGPEEERSFASPRLIPYREYTFRVIAGGGQAGAELVSEPLTARMEASPVYATVWPIKDLQAYTDPEMTKRSGTAKALTAYCVLEEVEGAFAVRVDGKTRYIDSNYCMIDLGEYLGDLCAYNITNSYDSLYKVHEFTIPNVTGVVTAGYGSVRQEDGSYLVPLLYPTARKLLAAAEAAREQGYRLKIYDAYRPYIATREIYDRTEKILEKNLPGYTHTGGSWAGLNLPAREEDEEGNLLPLTYEQVMLGDSHELNHFLAQGGSLHNLGIALDLTLEDAATGEELRMQTAMHDLSRYSVTGRNNEAAKTLAAIMTGAGFGGLGTEWWHFQDNEIRQKLQLPFAREGVSAQGWVRDETGWRYRTAGGTCLVGESAVLSGAKYTFDEYGYADIPLIQ